MNADAHPWLVFGAKRQAWVAGRAEGGALREVGTHFFFGIMELFGACCVGRVCAQVRYADGPTGSRAEAAAAGKLLLGEQAGRLSGLAIDLSVRTDSSAGDVYELEVAGERGSLLLRDFCQLKRTAPGEEWLMRKGSYGRVESVETLVDAVRAAEAGPSGPGRATAERGTGGGLITARQGRNAQRVLDAILASNGAWIDVIYD